MWTLIIILGIALYWGHSNPEAQEARKNERAQKQAERAAYESSPEYARRQLAEHMRVSIRGHLRETLKDFDSLKNILFSEPQDLDGAVRMRVSFNAKNSFGAYTKADRLYTFTTNNNTFTFIELNK